MPGFLYYLPEAKLTDLIQNDLYKKSALERWSLDQTLSDCTIYPDHVAARVCAGPDEKNGLVLTPRSLDGTFGAQRYNPRDQEWRLAEDESGKWIGWFKDQPPGPQDLIRRQTLGCKYAINDANGGEWAVITARSTDENQVSLPSTFTFKKNKLVTRIKPRYQSLFDLAGTVYDHMAAMFTSDEDTKEFLQNDEFLIHAAIQTLAVNYRISVAEIAVMDELDYELIMTETVTAILLCLIDQPVLEEFQKWNEALKEKKTSTLAPNLEASCSGQEEETQAIDQADAQSPLLN